jgi:hypothetical protein
MMPPATCPRCSRPKSIVKAGVNRAGAPSTRLRCIPCFIEDLSARRQARADAQRVPLARTAPRSPEMAREIERRTALYAAFVDARGPITIEVFKALEYDELERVA